MASSQTGAAIDGEYSVNMHTIVTSDVIGIADVADGNEVAELFTAIQVAEHIDHIYAETWDEAVSVERELTEMVTTYDVDGNVVSESVEVTC